MKNAKAPRSGLKMLIPYFGVLGAALVFISWIVTNSLVEHAKASQSKAEAVLSLQEQQQIYGVMWDRFHEFSRRLTGLDTKLDEIRERNVVTNNDDIAYMNGYREIELISTVSGEFTDLQRNGERLFKSANGFPSAIDLTNRAGELVEHINQACKQYDAILDTFASNVDNITHGNADRINLPLSQKRAIAQAASASVKRTDAIGKVYLDLSNKLLRLTDDLSDYAQNSATSAASHAHNAQIFSYVCFAVGTLLAMWAKYNETKEKSGIVEVDSPDA